MRALRSNIEGFLHTVTFRVVLGFFTVGEPLYVEFPKCFLLWLALPCFCRLCLMLTFGCFVYTACIHRVPPTLFRRLLMHDLVAYHKKEEGQNRE